MTSISERSGVTVLYGSETGNAQDYAQFLAKRLKYFGLKPTIMSLDHYPLKNLVTDTKFLIIICSTTGQGELPRNSKKFMKFLLKKKLPSDLLNHIELTTFGIGDSSYPKFNYAIKKIHARLLQLGCSELCTRCEADEQTPEGVDGYYSEWETNLLEALKKKIQGIPLTYDETVLLPADNPVEVLYNEQDIVTSDPSTEVSLTRIGDGSTDLILGSVKDNKRITKEGHFQDVRHLIIESENLLYIPGDTVALYPSNDEASVDALIQLQPHWIPIADKPLVIHGEVPFIEGGLIDKLKLTLRSLLTHHLDIISIPRRSFFMTLAHFSDASTEDGEREQEKLREFSRIEESEELYNYANRPRRLILETILEFQQNLRIPVDYILDLFPIIKPRLFLIASRPSPNLVELIVAVVVYKTILRRVRRGLCTKWLKLLQNNDKIVFSIHKSNLKFELPNYKYPPILMVSPGTGVAPMKSLIEHITLTGIQQDLYLFYGCRSKENDYLFGDLWDSLKSQNKLSIYPCFSRDLDSKVKYVQHKIYEQHELVGDLILNQNAILFICGSSGAMPREVRITLVEILVKFGKMKNIEADDYLMNMENTGRYLQETW
ncbi:NADPH-dependent diflavin oxidoreductase 1 [Debaryomyces fabryi]|uniref:NADPH-dependent diflavin oxidoreductase 1 n=1 Tax=Debaryomyces fabryi TaxID=58627 RepID=A0A0V1PQ62_9ASCO|nr:NADPH-dependent diflavin oxidoreductase 1 [Debaryomyces fabryi]KRZ98387.1 NADPH-dependent diflavin oxidoreductase 1 [Debaryomyces fabryi]CUM48070.1 unnamed protein product [Debaryomyces fabryi]